MSSSIFNPLLTNKLYGFGDNFNSFINLHKKKALPKVLLFNGKKGVGKFTFTLHLVTYFLDKTYNFENKTILNSSKILNQYPNYINENVIILSPTLENNKINDIRNLKKKLYRKTISNNYRFIILDDVEKFNHNALNSLLKVLEEPNSNDHFILINNNQFQILKTIKSRCLEINFYLKDNERINIINSLISLFNIDPVLDFNNYYVTPGNYLNFNRICIDNKLSDELDLKKKLNTLFMLYKKNKSQIYIELAIFFTDKYFYLLAVNNSINIDLINNIKINTIKLINEYVIYNLNINSVLDKIFNQFNHAK